MDNFEISVKNNKSTHKIFRILIIVFVVLAIISIILFALFKIKENEQRKKKELIYNDALNYCNSLYVDDKLLPEVSLDELNTCVKKVELIHSDYDKTDLVSRNEKSLAYLNMKSEVESYYDDGIVKSEVNQGDLDNLYKLTDEIDEAYKEEIIKEVDEIRGEYQSITAAKDALDTIYDFNGNSVKKSIKRSDYENAKSKIESLKQTDLKEEYSKYLDKVNEYLIQEEERIKKEQEEKRKQQESVNSAWVKLKVPYISQNLHGLHNACEAASLLMSLQYKGYLKDMTIEEYSELMPKSDDPNTGFYLSISSKYPTDVAHWIAPDPLAAFGRDSSGNSNVKNITGASIEDLANEILSGNPVVIYLTYNFLQPYNWSNGAPKNLHVQVLSGYNEKSKEYLITDPWYHAGGKYEFYLSKSKIEDIYNKVGKRAVVVR